MIKIILLEKLKNKNLKIEKKHKFKLNQNNCHNNNYNNKLTIIKPKTENN